MNVYIPNPLRTKAMVCLTASLAGPISKMISSVGYKNKKKNVIQTFANKCIGVWYCIKGAKEDKIELSRTAKVAKTHFVEAASSLNILFTLPRSYNLVVKHCQ